MTAKRKPAKPRKQAKITLPGASPISGTPPPERTRWKPGQTGNPHGRPRKSADFKELILHVMAEELMPHVTRIEAAIRIQLNKNPLPLYEYAFGKVPQPTHEMNRDEWREWLKENGYSDTDIESLADQFASFIRDRRIGAASVSTDDSKPDVQ